MTAKLDKIHEMYKLLNDKDHVNHDILSNFGRFDLVQTLRRLNMEKQQGVSVVLLIMALCLFRINGESIFSMYCKNFHDSCQPVRTATTVCSTGIRWTGAPCSFVWQYVSLLFSGKRM